MATQGWSVRHPLQVFFPEAMIRIRNAPSLLTSLNFLFFGVRLCLWKTSNAGTITSVSPRIPKILQHQGIHYNDDIPVSHCTKFYWLRYCYIFFTANDQKLITNLVPSNGTVRVSSSESSNDSASSEDTERRRSRSCDLRPETGKPRSRSLGWCRQCYKKAKNYK